MCANKLFRMLILSLLACIMLAAPQVASALELDGLVPDNSGVIDVSGSIVDGAITLTGTASAPVALGMPSDTTVTLDNASLPGLTITGNYHAVVVLAGQNTMTGELAFKEGTAKIQGSSGAKLTISSQTNGVAYYAGGTLVIDNAVLDVTATAENMSVGAAVYAYGDLAIRNSCNIACRSTGIWSLNELAIQDSVISVQTDETAWGIQSQNSVNVTGSRLTLNNDGYGAVALRGSFVLINGSTVSGTFSVGGIESGSDLTICNGSSIDMTCTETAASVLWASGSIEVMSSRVRAVATGANSNAAYASGTAVMLDGDMYLAATGASGRAIAGTIGRNDGARTFHADTATGSYTFFTTTTSAMPYVVVSDSPYTFTISGGAATITGYTGTETALTIPAEIGGYPVTTIAMGAFDNNDVITSVTLPEGLLTIGSDAFYGCDALVEVHLPSTLTRLREYAFSYCTKLAEIEIPASLAEIETSAFNGCSGLTSVTLHEGLKYLGSSAFGSCKALESIVLPEGLISVSSNAFTRCEKLSSVTLPESLNSIGESAFSYCTSLEQIKLPAGLKYIRAYAFQQCTALTGVDIPDSVATIETYAFNYCTSLTSVTLPSALTTIDAYAFSWCPALTEIDIPDGAATIGNGAFYKSNGLQNVTIPASVTSIGDQPFFDCTNLTARVWAYTYAHTWCVDNGQTYEVIDPDTLNYTYTVTDGEATITGYKGSDTALTLPSTIAGYPVVAVGDQFLRDKTAITSVVVPEGVTTIGTSAFNGCTALETCSLPLSMVDIGPYAFKGCVNLKSGVSPVVLTSLMTIGDYAFQNCAKLNFYNSYWSKSLVSIGAHAYENCTGLEGFGVPSNSSLVSIGDYAFAGCTSLTIAQDFGNSSIRSVGSYAFANCTALESFTLGYKTIQTIGAYAFQNCTSLKDVDASDLGYTPVDVGKGVFAGCTGLQTFTFPDSMAAIPDYFFDGCTGLLVISNLYYDEITAVSDYAFRNCSKLYSCKLPATVTSIGAYAFQNCDSLINSNSSTEGKFNLPAGLTTIGKGALKNANAGGLTVPEGVTEIPEEAFIGATGWIHLNSNDITYVASNAFTKDANGKTNLPVVALPGTATAAAMGQAGIQYYTDNSLVYMGNTLVGCESTDVLVKIHDGAVAIGAAAFADCTHVNLLTVPTTVTSIADDAFTGCTNLICRVYKDSYAHTWCEEKGQAYVLIEDLPFNYTVSGGQATITKYTGTDADVEIPGVIETFPVYEIAERTFSWDYTVQSVTIAEGVQRLDSSAFNYCSALTSVTLPRSLTYISTTAFYSCSADLVFHVYEGSYAHTWCVNNNMTFELIVELPYTYTIENGEVTITGYTGTDTEIEIPATIEDCPVTAIGDSAFAFQVNLTSVTLPVGVKRIGNSAFDACTGLTGLTLPEGLEEIGDCALSGCSGLTALTLPDSLTTIGAEAFNLCTGLTELILPAGVTAIGSDAFYGCSNLIPGVNKNSYAHTWCWDHGIAFDLIDVARPVISVPADIMPAKSGYFLADIGLDPADIRGIFPATVKVQVVNDLLMVEDYGAQEVRFSPKSGSSCSMNLRGDVWVAAVSAGADFSSGRIVSNYSTVWEAQYDWEGGDAQAAPYWLIASTNGNYVEKFAEVVECDDANGFAYVRYNTADGLYVQDCYYLTGALLWELVSRSGDSYSETAEYNGAGELTTFSATVGSDFYVYRVGSGWECNYASCAQPSMFSHVTDAWIRENYPMQLPAPEPSLPYTYTIENGEVTITGYTGTDTEIAIPATIEELPVKSIGDSAFLDCVDLTSISIPDSVTSIGSYAFAYCTSLTSISLPDSVTSIGDRAFRGCTELICFVYAYSYAHTWCVENDQAYEVIDPENLIPYTYTIENGVVTITGYTGAATEIEIPATIEGMPVTAIGDSAFAFQVNLTSVTLPAGVKRIGNSAFDACTGLTSLTLPEGLEEIGECALSGCSGLTALTLPGSLTTIGAEAFNLCTGLTELILPAGVTAIGSDAFYGCTNLVCLVYAYSYAHTWCVENDQAYEVIDPENLVPYTYTIENGEVTITGYTGTDTVIEIPATIEDCPVVKIGEAAFNGNTALQQVVISENVTSIGAHAFAGCTDLTWMTLPKSLESIGEEAFAGCDNLVYSVYANSWAHAWCIEGRKVFDILDPENQTDYTYSIENAEAIIHCYNGTATDVVMPTYLAGCPVTVIHNNAFTDHNTMTGVMLPETLKCLKWQVFMNCSSLTDVTLPDGLEEMGSKVFYNCTSLTGMTIPEKIAVLPEGTFSNCSALTSVTLPSGLTTIGGSAFYLCTVLKTVNIPESVTKIEAGAFQRCSTLTSIQLPAGLTELGSYCFEFSGLDGELVIPDGVTQIPNGIFWGCDNLDSVVLPENLAFIGNAAFYGCESLTEMSIPDSVTRMEPRVFSDCSNLRQVKLPAGISRLDNSTFRNCSSLTDIVIPDGVTEIGSAVFMSCGALESVEIPDSVTIFGDYTFENCHSLTSAHIPDGVTAIPQQMFMNCESLHSLTLPATVQSIGAHAFSACESLVSINIPDGVTRIESGTFTNCHALTGIDIPDSVQEMGSFAFSVCKSLTSVTIPANVTAIPDDAFSHCYALKHVTLPETLKSIGSYAFYMTDVQSVDIPASVETIGNAAFFDCPNLTRVFIRNGDTTMEGTLNFTRNSIDNAECTIYCYEYTNVDFWACDNGFTVVYLDGMDTNTPVSITLPEDCELWTGASLTIAAELFPAVDASCLTWTSSDETVLTVSGGVVTVVGSGTATVTASCGDVKDEMIITVRKAAESFALNCTDLHLVAKESFQLEVCDLTPADADVSFAYASGNTSVIQVSETGLASARMPGSAVITVTSSNGLTVECPVTVYYPVTAVEFAEGDKANTFIGDQLQLTANVTARDTTVVNKLVTFTTSDESIATVDENGLVTIVGVGEAEITATAASGITATITITAECTGHNAVPYEEIEVTCTTDGRTGGEYCTVCGSELTAPEVTPAPGHIEGDGITTLPVTCTEDGEVTYYCEVCGQAARVEVIPATGHAEGDTVITAQPDCVNPGKQVTQCANCGKTIAEAELPATGHDAVLDPSVDATCTAPGLTEGKHCADCGEVLVAQTETPALGHIEDIIEDWPKDCVSTGLTAGVYCLRCGDILVEPQVVPAGHLHTGTLPRVEPTCTTIGLTEGECCTACGETLVAQEIIPVVDHTAVIDPAVDATWTDEGLTEGSHCGVCGVELVAQESIPAIGPNVKPSHANCGYTCGMALRYANGCGYTWTVSNVQYTCDGACYDHYTNYGYQKHCTMITHASSAYAADHDGKATWDQVLINWDPCTGDTVVPPTCTESGYSTGTCIYCEADLPAAGKFNVVPALGHTESDEKGTVEATCTEAGSVTAACLTCGETIILEEIPALGHDYTASITLEATCIEPGVKTYDCLRCGDSYTEEIPLSGHEEEIIPAVPRGDLTPGYTEGVKCAFCGKTLVEPQYIPPIFEVVDGVLVRYNGDATEIVIPADAGITKLGDYLFNENTAITSVRIPAGVTEIGSFAFNNCTSLTDLVLPDGVTTIGASAFMWNRVYPFEVPASVTSIGSDAFEAGRMIICDIATQGKMLLGAGGVCFQPRENMNFQVDLILDGPYAPYVEIWKYLGDSEKLVIPAEIGGIEVRNDPNYYSASLDGVKELVLETAMSFNYTSVEGLIVRSWFRNEFIDRLVADGAIWIHEPHDVIVDAPVDPTCTEPGLTEGSHCDVCGEVLVAQEEIPAEGHFYGESITREPTCTTDGVKTFDCIGCGDVYEEAIPATGHDEAIDAPVDPTCTEPGLTEGSHCAVCGEVLVAQEEIPAEGHFYGESITREPTCTTDGVKNFDCIGCGDVYEEAIPATGHTEETIPAVPRGELTPGYTEGVKCAVCDDVIVEPQYIPAIFEVVDGVLVSYNGNATAIVIPENAGITKIGSGVFQDDADLTLVVVPAGVTEIGENAFRNCASLTTLRLPDSLQTIGANAFAGVPGQAITVLPANITTIGENAFGDTIPTLPAMDCPTAFALGSEYTVKGQEEFLIVAGCNADGSKSFALADTTATGDVIVPEGITEISAGLESHVNNGSITSLTLPDSVQEINLNSSAEDFALICEPGSAAAAAAEKSGLTWQCVQHSPVDVPGTEPTLEASGLTAGVYCPDCETWLTAQVTIPAKKHTVVTQAAVEPTCSADGLTEGSYCSECGVVFQKQEVIPATGAHMWNRGVVLREATCSVPGVKVYTCYSCGTEEEEILTAGHLWVDGTLTVMPTKTVPGEMTYTCRLCGVVKTEPILYGLPGDSNDDGQVDMLDVVTALEWFCGGAAELNLANTDVTADGMYDMLDIINILAWYCGNEDIVLQGPAMEAGEF